MSVYLGDFKEDGDLFHKFTTRKFSTGAPFALASGVLSVYKDEGGAATEKTTAEAYFDLDVDHDSITGWNNVRIDLSGDAFFATGADYSVVITTGTVDSVSVVGETLFTFSIENRSMGQPAGATLAADIAALKTVADAIPTTAMRGTEGANTTTPPTVAAIADGVADEVITGGAHNVTNSLGRRIRLLAESGNYASGLVWLDDSAANTNTTSFEDGTEVNPVSTIAAVNTILAALPLHGVHVASGTSITFAASQQNQEFTGEGWTLALGSRDISGSTFLEADVSGISTAVPHAFIGCHLGAVSFAGGDFLECELKDTFTMTGATAYFLINCYHGELGAASTVDFGSAVGASEVHIHGWKGNLLIRNMDAGDILHFTCSEGMLELDNSNTAGTINYAGNFVFTDGSSGMTTNDLGNITSVLGALDDTAAAGDVTTADSLMQYIKQLLNELSGSVGIGTMPAAADPSNGINLFEILRRVFDDSNAIEPITTALTSAAATKLALTMGASPSALVDTTGFASTTTEFESDGITTAAADHFIGRIVLFTTGTGDLDEQATDITDYALVGGRGHFTVTALTSAPANNAPFIII